MSLVDRENLPRDERIRRIADDCMRRRAAGESLPDSAIITAHAELMPELGAALQTLALIRAARHEAVRDARAHAPDPVRSPDAGEVRRLPTDAFPGYEIVRELSHGGQGVVYQAVQKSTKRKVAIKVLIEGPHASKSTRKRFEREIELVAALKHPNIIAIFHSGETADGRQYYVMDYVRGVPMHQYAREKRLGLQDTIRLFAVVCHAIQYAHQRGVIHRDIKPTNVLVDTDGIPKILDFGLAKLLAGPVDTVLSISKAVVGTLPYMSPEQARGNPDEIDTRTDVYALGVNLYELLTGRYPYPVEGQLAEILRHITDTPPTPPTRHWTPTTGVAPKGGPSAARPGVEGACPIDDEVATIVLKALSKERERRYQSAGELARDIEHYLAGEPIEARRDSALYVLRKTMRRYKLHAAVAGAFVLMAIGAAIGLSVLYSRQSLERQRAEEQRALAQSARLEALAARDLAERERARAEEKAESMRHGVYANAIALAQAAYEEANIQRMQQLLAACDSELRGWEWQRLRWLADPSLRTFSGRGESVYSVAWSPDGTRIATGGGDNSVRLWDIETGQELHAFTLHSGPVTAVAFSRDGNRLVSASEDGTARVWSVEPPAAICVFREHGAAVSALAFTADGREVISGGSDQTLRIWSIADCREQVRLESRGGSVTSIALSADGDLLAAGSEDATIALWNLARRRELPTLRGHEGLVSSVAFDASSRRLVSASADYTLRVWSVDGEREPVMLKGHTGPVNAVAFDAGGRRIVSGSADTSLRIWDADTGKEIHTLRGHLGPVAAVAISRDGRRIMSGSFDATAKLWDIKSGQESRRVPAHEWSVAAVAFGQGGRAIVSHSVDSNLKVWEPIIGQELRTLPLDKSKTRLAFSPDGGRFVAASDAGPLRIFDLASGQEIRNLKSDAGWVTSLAYAAGGNLIVTGGRDGLVRLWDIEAESAREFRGHVGAVACVAVSADGQRIASGGYDATGRLWNATGEPDSIVLKGHTALISAIAISADGRRAVTGGHDNTLRLWNGRGGDAARILTGHSGVITAVAFSPDGRRILSGSEDATLRLWNAVNGDELFTLRCDQPVKSATFDGERIVAGCVDGALVIFDISGPPPDVLEARRLADDARRLVDALFSELYLRDDVVERVVANGSIGEALRNEALRLAQARADDPRRLQALAWSVVRNPSADASARKRALRAAQAAARLIGDDPELALLLGAAHLRSGQHEEALAMLLKADSLRAALTGAAHPADVAFLALTLHHLDRTEEARAALRRLGSLMKQDRWAGDDEMRELAREAETTIVK